MRTAAYDVLRHCPRCQGILSDPHRNWETCSDCGYEVDLPGLREHDAGEDWHPIAGDDPRLSAWERHSGGPSILDHLTGATFASRRARLAGAVARRFLQGPSPKERVVAFYRHRRAASVAHGRAYRIALGMEEGVPEAIVASFDLQQGRTAGIVQKLKKVLDVLKVPKILGALKSFGALSIEGVKKLAADGKKALEGVWRSILDSPVGWLLQPKHRLPSITDLIKRTAIGARVFDWLERNVKPKADLVDAWLRQHVPHLRTVLVAAIFVFVWFNVDEVSWAWDDILKGFTGQISLADLLLSLPESAIGLLTGSTLGIGYTVMPYLLAARIAWLLSQHYLEWTGGKLVPNFKKVDKAEFDAAR